MRIDPPEITIDGGTITSSLPITSTGDARAPSAFTIETVEHLLGLPPEASIDTSVAPFVPMAVVAAVALRQDLEVGEAITPQQAAGAGAAGELLGGWLDASAPTITGPVDAAAPAAPADGVGLFFTRGIDSWSSLLEHRERVTHLLFLDGVEPRMSAAARARVNAENENVAREMDLPLITLRTNGRDQLEPFCTWEYAHGAVLASAALLLAPLLGEVLVASSHAEAYTRPWGTHAELDPLWSTPRVRFVHDGRRFTRWDKIERVAACQPALDSLQICWTGGGDRNCGRCAKCLVTMTVLDAIGALDRCPRFDGPLDLDAVSRLPRLAPGRGSNVVDLLGHLPPDSAMARAWAQMLDPAMLARTARR